MAYDALEYVRVEAEFLALGGGELWDRVVEAAWLRSTLERARTSAKQREFRARESGRRYHREAERHYRQRNKTIPSAVRCCPVCRGMYTRTRAQERDGTGAFCGPRCAAIHRYKRRPPRPQRMVTLNGRTLALPAWAAQLGISLSLVYRRMREGMDAVEALTAPKRRTA